MKLLLHLLTSLHGTKRTSRDRLLIVRFWREADMPRPRVAYRSSANNPWRLAHHRFVSHLHKIVPLFRRRDYVFGGPHASDPITDIRCCARLGRE